MGDGYAQGFEAEFESIFEDDLVLELDPLESIVEREIAHVSRRLIDPERNLFERDILTPAEFFSNPDYAGTLADPEFVWPVVKQEMIEASSLAYRECVFTGAQGTAKTTRANGPILYLLYLLGEMYDPCRTLGVLDGENLFICFTSTSKEKAEDTGFAKFRNIVKTSRYFQERFRPDAKVKSQLEFPKGIIIKPIVPGEDGILGLDLIALVIDEANKMPRVEQSKKSRSLDEPLDVARTLYKSARIRNRTRFLKTGQSWGKIMLLGETGWADDFIEERIRDVIDRNETDVYVSRKALWEAKPRGNFSPTTFRVEIGTSARQSRIIPDDEATPQGADLLEPPIDFRSDFETDLEGSIRKLGGRALFGVSPLITNRAAVQRCIRSPKNRELYKLAYEDRECIHPFSVPKTSFAPNERLLREALARKDEKTGLYTPFVNPEAWRAIHIDFGLRQDRCGFAMSHCAGLRTIERRNAYNELEAVPAPDIYTDIALQIVPHPGTGEVNWFDIERLIEELVEIGFHIGLITTDKASGPIAVQSLQRSQFEVELLSVDREPHAYIALRQAYNEGRHSIYHYDPYLNELLNLEWWASQGKVDHKGGASKDVADAVCGSVYACLTRLIDANPRGSSVSVMRF